MNINHKRVLSTGFYLFGAIVYVLLIVCFIHTKDVDVGIWCILLYLMMSRFGERIDSEPLSGATIDQRIHSIRKEISKLNDEIGLRVNQMKDTEKRIKQATIQTALRHANVRKDKL